MPETPATTSPQTPIFPPGRYGRRREPRPRSRWLTGVAAVCLAVLAVFVGVSLFNAYGDGDYSHSVTAFTDITDNQVVVTFRVRLPEDGKAVCVVRARDETGAETGSEEITVTAGPDPGRTMVTHRLVTRTRPVTGEVKGCRPA